MQPDEPVMAAENFDISNIITPVKPKTLENLLSASKYPRDKTQFLVKGFSQGFRIGYQGDRFIKRYAPNLRLSVGTPVTLWNKVIKEVEKGRYAGPFKEVPFEHFIQSPIGLVPKDQGKDTRLIFHLSYPRSGKSVNSETPDEYCSVKYPDFSEAIQLCMELTKKARMKGKCGVCLIYSGKSDMKSAFRNLPIAPQDYMLLIMKATNPKDGLVYYFVDKCLPFGASISCAIFQEFSNSVAWIFKARTGKKTVNYLDDYYFAALVKALCDGQIRAFLEICDLIGFPVSLEKTEWGTTIIVFLGFLIDAVNQIVGIPVEKVERAIKAINDVLNKKSKKITVHQLQKLCGFLNHLCRCIIPGRAFIRRLYAYTGNNLLPHHHIKVTQEMKSDLGMWLTFLGSPNIYCRPFMDFNNLWNAHILFWYTDASANRALGFGGIFDGKYFWGKWSDSSQPGERNFIDKYNPSIEFLELYGVAVSVFLWLKYVPNRHICLFTDNESVMNMVNNSSSSCKHCMVLIRMITLEGLRHNVRIHAKHVRSKENFLADSLSRLNFREFYKDVDRLGIVLDEEPESIPEELWPIQKLWKKY